MPCHCHWAKAVLREDIICKGFVGVLIWAEALYATSFTAISYKTVLANYFTASYVILIRETVNET